MPRRTRLAVLTAVLGAALVGLQPAPAGALATPTTTPAPAVAPAAQRANPVTPGTFTGYGFDQCLTPEQYKMDAWLAASPFRAVGVYTSGASRACRDQPNLTATWVSTQLAKGWRILPITLGPQAFCNPRFPRYGEAVVNGAPGADGSYGAALAQGRAEASTAVAAAQALGIVPGSTLWYDMEGYDSKNTGCRESALSFMSGWTQGIKSLGYVSGVYSSAGSGIKDLDDARVLRPGRFTMPDQIWVARWDGVANTSTSYMREDGWRPGGRVKQYKGGHNETWGGVTINIDSNYLELGATTPTAPVTPPTTACGGTQIDLANYSRIKAPTRSAKPDGAQVAALKCLLKQQGLFKGKTKGAWSERLTKAVKKWQKRAGMKKTAMFSRKAWMVLLAAGTTPTLGAGSTGEDVKRLQRTLNAASPRYGLPVTGSYDAATDAAVRTWQAKHGLAATGSLGADSWTLLQAGKR